MTSSPFSGSLHSGNVIGGSHAAVERSLFVPHLKWNALRSEGLSKSYNSPSAKFYSENQVSAEGEVAICTYSRK